MPMNFAVAHIMYTYIYHMKGGYHSNKFRLSPNAEFLKLIFNLDFQSLGIKSDLIPNG